MRNQSWYTLPQGHQRELAVVPPCNSTHAWPCAAAAGVGAKLNSQAARKGRLTI